MQKLYIIKTGSTFPHIAKALGDFEDWIAQGLEPVAAQNTENAEAALPIEVIHAACLNDSDPAALPVLENCAGVVITGSHDMVTDGAAWMQDLQDWLHQVCMADIPVLGICFGHQLLAQALGGHVGQHPQGLELGSVSIQLQCNAADDPLWHDMPPTFSANVVHYQTVRQLPAQAVVMAGNSHEPHQAFRWRSHVWGVQFHPEFNTQAMQAYINHVNGDLAQHGIALQNKHTQCSPTPEAAQLLQKFALYTQSLARKPRAWKQAA